jgi:hypothetical protein
MTEATHEAPSAKAQPARALNGLMLMAAVVSAISGGLYGYDTGIISDRQRAVGGLDRRGKRGSAHQVAVDGSSRGAALGQRPHDQ